MIILHKEFHFSGAHKLVRHSGQCKNLHGHTWKGFIEVHFVESGSVLVRIKHLGWLIDFHDLKNIVEKYDHAYINDKIEGHPSAENLAKIIYDEVTELVNSEGFVEGHDYKDIIVRLYESDTAYIEVNS